MAKLLNKTVQPNRKPSVHETIKRLEEKTFTIEFNGVELLALYQVAARVGGLGKLRDVFSNTPDSIYAVTSMIIREDEDLDLLKGKIKDSAKGSVMFQDTFLNPSSNGSFHTATRSLKPLLF